MDLDKRSTAPLHAGITLPAGDESLVLACDVDFKELVRLNKAYPWKKPTYCPRCRGGLWWHGFVLAYLSTGGDAVFLRRLRCPQCRAVHRLRPNTHWRRFHTPCC